MIPRTAVMAMLTLAFGAAAQEPAADDAEAWKAEEEAVLREAAARGITPDKKGAAVAAAAAEQFGSNVLLPDADEHVVSHSKLFSVSGGDSLRMGAIASRADDLYNQVCKLLQLEKLMLRALKLLRRN